MLINLNSNYFAKLQHTIFLFKKKNNNNNETRKL